MFGFIVILFMTLSGHSWIINKIRCKNGLKIKINLIPTVDHGGVQRLKLRLCQFKISSADTYTVLQMFTQFCLFLM